MRSSIVALLMGLPVLLSNVAGAQAGAVRIGFLSPAVSSEMAVRVDRFRRGLAALGYVEGKDMTIEYRWAEGAEGKLKGLAAELAPKVDLVVAHGTQAAKAVQQTSEMVPIVCFGCGDAVSIGLVSSLARPGGTITGQTTLAPEATGKRVELLKEAIPRIKRLAVLWNEHNPVSAPELKETEEAARAAGLELQSVAVATPGDFPAAFRAMKAENAEAVIVLSDAMFFGSRKQIADLAIAERLPAVSWNDEYANSGFLLSYGPDVNLLADRAAPFVDKILKGAKPADLPIEQPTKFDLAINLKTAKAIGAVLSPALLARADEVIE